MEEQVKQNGGQYEFKAEMKQLLRLIVHSLYTHPEVFLRELISNSSDALNKLRFKKLTDSHIIIDPEDELRIDITLDKENNTFTIEDNGIGMDREDLMSKLGTVASSGTYEFLRQMKENKSKLDGNLIGQFGVGFYSVFMVTEEVTVETRYAEKESKALTWKSAGTDTFTIEDSLREKRGTKISFKLKDEYKEFAEDHKVKATVRKYSNFVDFPLYVNGEKVNTITAIWHRRKDDIKEEELNEFYKFISNDYQDPLGHLQLDIEGAAVNFKALIFIPKSAPPELFRMADEKTLQLYSSKIFIQDNAKELLPEYLRFAKGVVDTEDLPLNVSREVTQNSPLMAKMRSIITGKIIGLLEEWAHKDKEKYETFFRNFGPLFKTGVNSDFSNKDRIIELLRFESSQVQGDELTSFNGYVSRMKPDQKHIYYITGGHRSVIERNPNLEYFKKREIEVLYLTDPVDIFTIPSLGEYDGRQLQSIEKSDIDLSSEDEKTERLPEDLSKPLIEVFKETLGDDVEDVIVSKRLVDSPATLVVGKQGMDPQMEKMMQIMDKDFTASKRILEINTAHPLIKNLSTINIKDSADPMLRNAIRQIFDGAMLIEGYLKDPNEFVKRMNELMTRATDIS
ncbi:MAG: molecular chaperone HtpG [Candidatus Kapaibacterium sp.]